MNEEQLKMLSKLRIAILSSYITSFALKEVKHLGLFKGNINPKLRQVQNYLIGIEKKYFALFDNSEGKDLGSALVENQIDFLNWMTKKYNTNDFEIIQEICMAYDTDPKRLKSISDKILLKNGAKKI